MKITFSYAIKRIIICFLAVAVAISLLLFAKNNDYFNGVPEEVKEYSSSAFYYNGLSEKCKKAYNLIMQDIFSFPTKILVPTLSNNELDELYEAILYDCPELFFLKGSCQTGSEGMKNYFYPEYEMDMEEYQQKLSELQKSEYEIINNIPSDDEFEIELYLHDALIKRCDYSDEVNSASSSPYGCLVEGYASCEGYAKEMKRLLDACSIECILATGEVFDKSTGSHVGHMWDIVKIGGKYYHLDPTWDDNNNDNSRLSYSYFNNNDELLQKTHTISEKFVGICNSLDDNYFVKTSSVFAEYNENTKNSISALLIKNADSDISVAPFMFESEEAFKRAKKDLFDDEQIYRLLDRANMVSRKKIITDSVKYWPDDLFYIITVFDFYE